MPGGARHNLDKPAHYLLYCRQVYSQLFLYCKQHRYILPVKAPGKQDSQTIYDIVEDKEQRKHPPGYGDKVSEDKLKQEYQHQGNEGGLEQVPA